MTLNAPRMTAVHTTRGGVDGHAALAEMHRDRHGISPKQRRYFSQAELLGFRAVAADIRVVKLEILAGHEQLHHVSPMVLTDRVSDLVTI